MISRTIFAAVFLASSALAAPRLTTIQDVLYKADGTRFNGTLVITWSSFQAGDASAIATQSTTVRVVDGNLRVQLVPTTSSTPPMVYSVTYNSDGRFQFQETWDVPTTTQPVRLRDIRVVTATVTSADTGTGTTSVEESDVVGLTADLGARPIKGPGYAAGRVAIVNPTGALESVSGIANDCVRVDGSSGPCGSGGTGTASFVDADTPSGIVDGANTQFTLSAQPDPAASLALYRNGILQKVGQDYTLSGPTLTFAPAAIPQPGDTLLASYRRAEDDAGSPQTFPASQVLCSGTGGATTAAVLASIGTCSISAGVLLPGDRVEVRFDLEHQGAASGFSFQILWGATALVHRDAAATDTLVTGRADAGILAAGAQLSFQSWGAVLPFSAGVANASDAYGTGLTIDFQGNLASASGDTLTLRNFTVVRLP